MGKGVFQEVFPPHTKEAIQRPGYAVGTVSDQYLEKRLYSVDLADQVDRRDKLVTASAPLGGHRGHEVALGLGPSTPLREGQGSDAGPGRYKLTSQSQHPGPSRGGGQARPSLSSSPAQASAAGPAPPEPRPARGRT